VDDLYQDIEQTTMLLRSIIFDTTKAYENNKISIELCEKEIIDIEHVIELTTFNASRGYALSKEIKDVRIRRRELKDQNELLSPLVEIVNRLKSFQNDLNKAIGDIRRIKQKHENRSYKMRVRMDLQEEVQEWQS
jgi:ribonuclease BN (tRNA processing enzyme)